MLQSYWKWTTFQIPPLSSQGTLDEAGNKQESDKIFSKTMVCTEGVIWVSEPKNVLNHEFRSHHQVGKADEIPFPCVYNRRTKFLGK